MLDFHIEWEDAPTVRSPSLGATWARLEIRVGDRPVTRFWSESANAIRSGVYGSLFPLAQWIARHWWHLLEESIPHPAVLRGARRAGVDVRSWMERHNLVYSREGMAYPDLSIYREDELIGLRWTPDPEGVTTPGRFLGEGATHLCRAEVEAALARLVESVLERTAELDVDEVHALRADWGAVQSSSGAERALCERLAGLGLDPYAPEPDELLEDLLSSDLGLPKVVMQDLLAVTTRDRVDADLKAARDLIARLPESHANHRSISSDDPYDPRPYRAGYRRAEAVRREFGMNPESPLSDPLEVLERQFGTIITVWTPEGDRPDIEAAVERNGVYAIAASARPARAQRFLLARAFHHWQFVTHGAHSLRLLTRARDWQQSASRAFAAELLAPAAALAARLKGESGWDFQTQLADEFQVDSEVIAHQLVNHGLG